ncbi:sulfite exporter TauE/SafE family protein [Aquella oligotrophica]|uniref:Probable membrane transporter protein n=1 Tax=Aquella oligotrophica TaxID=2067065 RepID=A0A2I7N8K9_9NEIS|nr:sulfite exporter TauE/SafE family protein [Aquella oligotrophica]AUR52788.1 permease [Aquella oligotrophica]
MEYFILVFFGVLTGMTASLFGFGGGFVIVPLIYHMVGNNPHAMQIAVATSTSIMIINSINAIYRHNRAGNILWSWVTPIAYFIGIGSIFGAALASHLGDKVVKYTFVAYISYVIYDCLTKKEFIQQKASSKTLSTQQKIWNGLGIGIIASALGVGGSVLTVPLMRKLGLSMKHAVALANPLSLPVAIIATIIYIILGEKTNINPDHMYLGFIYLPGVIILSICGFIGVPIGTHLAGKISDQLHAKIYIGLLFIAILSILV